MPLIFFKALRHPSARQSIYGTPTEGSTPPVNFQPPAGVAGIDQIPTCPPSSPRPSDM